MDKLQQFKAFAAANPHLGDLVHSGQTNWQELFETYDIYGPDHQVFKQSTQGQAQSQGQAKPAEESKINWNQVIQTLSSVDYAKVSDGLNGLKKVLDLFSQLSPANQAASTQTYSRRPFRRYND